jgi:outer membrane protein assembly factor BamB
MRSQRVLSLTAAAILAGGATFAQVGRGGSEWLTALGDAQRTSWIRNEPRLSVELMSKPGFELQWTSKLDNQPRGLHGLAQGVSANGVTLFVPMSVVAGSSNTVYGIDNDLGYIVWKRQFEAAMPAPTAECPGGIPAAATRIVNLEPPPITAPATPAAGRGAVGYRSLLGEPGEGVPVEARGGGPGRGRQAGAPAAGAAGAGRGAAPAAGRAGGRGAAAGPAGRAGGAGRGAQGPTIPGAPPEVLVGGNARPSGVAYVVSSDGVLHVLGLPSGKDIQRPAPFLPANARWSDAIAVGTRLYAATSGNCGGAPDGVWAIDLASEAKPVVSWHTNGGGVVGPVAFTTTGTLMAAIGPGQATGDGKANAIVALDPTTLQVLDWYTHPSAEFVTGPTILRHNDREIVAAATKDGRILMLDAASLGGPDHGTPLHASRSFLGSGGATVAGSLATWQEATITPPPAGGPAAAGDPAPAATVTLGTRWILAPVNGALSPGVPATNGAVARGSVVALKLVEGAGGALSLEPGWVSHDLVAPATPIIVNGVVFALSTGRPASGSGSGAPAVLHAYEGATGKALWNSGTSMTTFASPGSFWSAMGQAYIGTHDGTLYAFGFLDERR